MVALKYRWMRAWPLALFLALPALTHGQERAKPLLQEELWSSAAVQGHLPSFLLGILSDEAYKKLRLSAEVGYRSADTFFAGRQVYTDLSARYKVSKHVSLTAEHRIAFRPSESTRHRTGVQANLGTKWKRFDLGYRLNYQHNYRDFGEQREILRNRFGAAYDIKKFKLDPEVTAEFFTWMGHQGWNYIGTRYSIGTQWAMSKAHTFGLSVVHDREYGIAWPTYRWIYSLSYTLDLREL
jgi:hypothetical protein